jgi:hypothetical protein
MSSHVPQAKRAVCEFVQLNTRPPQQVFPLLCPVREAEWLPKWKYRLVYSQSGVAELGAVFTTPNDGAPETAWIVTHYDPAKFQIAFAWVRPEMLATRLEIALSPAGQERTSSRIRYTYTALSAAGEPELERLQATFEQRMRRWEKAINHYLEHGAMLSAADWEKAGLS